MGFLFPSNNNPNNDFLGHTSPTDLGANISADWDGSTGPHAESSFGPSDLDSSVFMKFISRTENPLGPSPFELSRTYANIDQAQLQTSGNSQTDTHGLKDLQNLYSRMPERTLLPKPSENQSLETPATWISITSNQRENIQPLGPKGPCEALPSYTRIKAKKRKLNQEDRGGMPRKPHKDSKTRDVKIRGVPEGFCFAVKLESKPQPIQRLPDDNYKNVRGKKTCLRCRQQKLRVGD